jgi:transglutaminase-like putative cysteine protease
LTAIGEKTYRCPLVFAAAALLALGLLAKEGEGMVPAVAIVLAVLFAAQYATSHRLPQSITIEWLVRLFILVTAAMLARNSLDSNGDAGDPRSFIIVGCVAAGEMVIQSWRVEPARLSLILCAGIVYLSGCYQNTDGIVPWITPLFFLLLIVSWRTLDWKTQKLKVNRRAVAAYIAAIALALAIGSGGTFLVSSHNSEIYSFAERLLGTQKAPTDSGMSNNPQLSSVFGSEGSPERVLLVHGPLSDPHMRAAAFHNYENGFWSPGLIDRPFIPIGEDIGSGSSDKETVEVTKLRYSGGLIYCPLNATYIGLEQQDSVDWCPATGGPIRSKSLPPATYTFSVSGGNGDYLDRPLQRTAFAEDLVVSKSINARVVALAKQITAKSKTDTDKVNAICGQLDANHGYSLNYIPGPGDPLSGFILSKKSAHCEYFASSAVMLLRCVHIPARYVIGYYAHEQDGLGNIVVRQRDAHAWAEAYVDGAWTTVDATPSGGRPDKFFGDVPLWERLFEGLEDRIQLLQDEARNIGPEKIIGWTVALVVAYFGIRVLIAVWRSRRRTKKVSYQNVGVLAVYVERFIRLLKKNQITIPDVTTWSEYLELTPDLPISHDELAKFVITYNSLRFGGSGTVEDLSAQLDLLERN